MAALIVGALVPHEGWATSELGNICLASSSCDSPNPPSLTFGLELTLDPPVCLFFPARGVTLVAKVGPNNEAHIANADAAATEQPPGAPDLAAILVTMQQGFAELKSGQAQRLLS